MPKLLQLVVGLLSRKIRKKAGQHQVGYSFLFMRGSGEQLSTLGGLIDSGVIQPVIDKVFPFEETENALAYVEAGRARGKVVVQVVAPDNRV
jgi:NADPH:quinone reductase-like Zn-dependent oxidoreductase